MLVQDSSIAPMLCIQPAGYSTFFPSTLQLHHVVPSVYSPRLSIMLGNAFLSSQAPAYRHNPPYCSTVTSPRHIHHLPNPSFPTTYTYRHQPHHLHLLLLPTLLPYCSPSHFPLRLPVHALHLQHYILQCALLLLQCHLPIHQQFKLFSFPTSIISKPSYPCPSPPPH